MNDTLSNKLRSFKGTLATAHQPEYEPIWKDQPPLLFTELMTEVTALVAGLDKSGAEQSAPITGTAAGLRALRLDLQDSLHVMARSLYRQLLADDNIADAPKADLTPSDLRNARATALANFAETVLDLAETYTVPPSAAAAKRGITPEAVTALDTLWENYRTAIGAPASARSGRKARTEMLPQLFRETEAKFAELDDYAVQFRRVSPVGEEFVMAWFNSRHVDDLGRRAAKPIPPMPPTPPTPPVPPAP